MKNNAPSEFSFLMNGNFKKMIENGLVKEVESLMAYRNQSALRTVGYAELLDFLDGKSTLENAIELIKQHSRNYAKRQLTWFKNQGEFKLIQPEIKSIIPFITE